MSPRTPPPTTTTLPGRPDYEGFIYTPRGGGASHPVFWRGPADRPGILVMHELPGLTKETVALADRLVTANYRVFLPHLFGTPMSDSTVTNLARLCVSAEFGRLAANVTAPVTNWLRALATDISRWSNEGRIGAIGMCLTGGFVIPLMLEPVVGAPVTSQPAIPLPRFPIPVPILSPRRIGSELDVARADLDDAIQAAKDRQLTLVGFRFSGDWKCPHDRFVRLGNEFKERFEPHEFPTPDPGHGLKKSVHSVLTFEYRDANEDDDHPSHVAMRRVLEFFGTAIG